ncbi:hypothetical protein H7H82_13380 [Mycobacterium heidelbergense]|nr:hypothetical protein [Mycobacterium heidelbergense]
MVGASLIAVTPIAPAPVPVEIQQRAVELTSGIGDVVTDYQDVFNQSVANLQILGSQAEIAIPGLLDQIGGNLSGYGGLINAGLLGAQTGLQNALYGGWYGGDDGFVFGLFGGSVTHAGVTETGSTLQEILTSLGQGNFYGAFGYYDEWVLEAMDHTLKPLLSPILNTAKAGATPTPTIPGEMLQTLTNVSNTFLSYSNLKALSGALLSPQISVTFGALQDLGKIGGDLSTGNLGGAVTDALKMPANFVGNLLNGYVNPSALYNPTGQAFTGLLNSGSLLQQLLVTWPNQLAQALGQSTTPAAAVAAGSTAAQLTTMLGANGITGLASGLGGNLAGIIPGALLRIVTAVLGAL